MTSYLSTNFPHSHTHAGTRYAFTKPSELWKPKVFFYDPWFTRQTVWLSRIAWWLHIRDGRLITSLARSKSIIIVYRATAWGREYYPKNPVGNQASPSYYGRPTRRPAGRKSWIVMKIWAGYHPRTLYFSETRRQGGSNAGSIMGGAWCMLEQQEMFYFFF